MKEQQCSIAKRMKYVVLPDLQIRAVPRPVVHLIPGVIILALPFIVYTPYIYQLHLLYKNRRKTCEIYSLQSRLEIVSHTAVAAICVQRMLLVAQNANLINIADMTIGCLQVQVNRILIEIRMNFISTSNSIMILYFLRSYLHFLFSLLSRHSGRQMEIIGTW